jgi:DNA-binding transcriptional regulator YdaS (Cro superfamily)
MKLSAYYASLPIGARRAFADSIGVAPTFLYQMATGRRQVPGTLCADIEGASLGAVTVHDLRPDIFGPAPGIPPEPPAAEAKEQAA